MSGFGAITKNAILIVLVVVLGLPLGNANDGVLIVDEHLESRLLNDYLSTWVSPVPALDTASVIQRRDKVFEPLVGEPKFGHFMGTAWLKFRLRFEPTNPAISQKQFLLELQFSILKVVKLIRPGMDPPGWQEQDLGYGRAFSERPRPFRNPVFPLTLTAGEEQVFYLAVQRVNGAVKAPLKLWNPEVFTRYQAGSNFFLGGVLITLFIMFIYNLFIFLSVRENMYFYYSGYILSNCFTILAFTGIGFQFFWPEQPWLNEKLLPLASFSSMMFLALFIIDFLELKTFTPILSKIFFAVASLFAAINVGLWFTDFYFGRIINYSIGLGSLLIIVTISMRLMQSPRKTLFFATAFMAFFAGGLLYSFDLANIVSSSFISQNGFMIGVLCEIVMLSFAVADRINIEKQQRISALESQRDVFIQLEKTKQALIYRGTHNVITGAPNRLFLNQKLQPPVVKQLNDFTLFILHLNGFQNANHSLGHVNGDQIIIQYTQALIKKLNHKKLYLVERAEKVDYYFAQVNVNTYCAVVSGSDYREEQMMRFYRALPKAIVYQNMEIDLQPSMGYACYPRDSHDFDELIKFAYVAGEAAANQGRTHLGYSKSLDNYSERNLLLMSELRSALSEDQLLLHFQPQVCLKTGKIIGVECLLRWKHPDKGFIPPGQFVPYAEQMGIISQLTHWVINDAIHHCQHFSSRGIQLVFSINISAKNLKEVDFVDNVTKAIAGKVDPKNIIFEITETSVMDDIDESMRVLNTLADNGFRLSIDDFGTGYSSLAYLKKLPVNELKIDRSFIAEMAHSHEDRLLVKTMIEMAKALGIKVVAEGIEDEATLTQLSHLDCDIVQGYYLYKPMDAEALTTVLDKHLSESVSPESLTTQP